jgi:hypothetical protein
MNQNARSFVVYDGERIQSQKADDFIPAAKGRRYLTHTFKGNKSIIPGEINEHFHGYLLKMIIRVSYFLYDDKLLK